jgi:hypothetical protein
MTMAAPNPAKRMPVGFRKLPAVFLSVFQRFANMLVRMHALTAESTMIGCF